MQKYNGTADDGQWLNGSALPGYATLLRGKTPEKVRRCVRERARDFAATDADYGVGDGSIARSKNPEEGA